MAQVPTVTLNTGSKMPLIGLGTWKIPKRECPDVIYNALKTGYRLFDCAQDYDLERECGEGLKRALDDGVVKREEVFVTSKLWNTYHAKEHVEPMLRRSLEDWGLEYFDLFLMHFPLSQKYVDPKERYPPTYVNNMETGEGYYDRIPISETWQALEECVAKGLIKNIGISNFNSGLVRDLLSYAKIPPAILQVEHHPYLTQRALIKYVQSEGIVITAYSSFGPQSFVEMNHPRVKDLKLVLDHPVIDRIAKAHNRSPAEVVLRWATQRNIVVIPKSNRQNELEQNLQHTTFDLSEEEIEQVQALDIGLRFNDPLDWNPPTPIF